MSHQRNQNLDRLQYQIFFFLGSGSLPSRESVDEWSKRSRKDILHVLESMIHSNCRHLASVSPLFCGTFHGNVTLMLLTEAEMSKETFVLSAENRLEVEMYLLQAPKTQRNLSTC